jgi:hypothetical protein
MDAITAEALIPNKKPIYGKEGKGREEAYKIISSGKYNTIINTKFIIKQ